ncbi:MAG: peptidylprolyl isomerase [Rubrivivax sp.]
MGTARYSQSVLLTVSGSNLDQGLTVASPGCRAGTIQRSTTAPNVSSAGTAYYTCTVSEVGAQQFSVTRSSDGTALRTQAFTVEVPQVTLVMDRGTGTSPATLVLTLTPQQTPVTVTNFLDYVNSGFYVGTVFHRNSPGFVLQGGGFTGPLMAGGPAPTPKATRPPIVLEVGRGLSNLRYTVAMARTNDVNSATSQFFINLVDNVFLDSSGGGYAVFGSITTGTDRVQTYANSTDCFAWAALLPAGDCLPTPNITITSAIQTR